MDEIHKKLKQLRKERGVTLNSLAEKMGVDYQQLSRIERGKSRLNINVLMKMAEALETPISEIVTKRADVITKFPADIQPVMHSETPSEDLLGIILEQIEVVLEEAMIPLRPQTKAALATQIYNQAVQADRNHLPAKNIIHFSIQMIKTVIADKNISSHLIKS